MKVSLLAIGSELLDGRVHDTNCQFASDYLTRSGIQIDQFLFCDDEEGEIVEALHFLSRRATCVITSGGLGPTTDDLTREAVALFAGLPLYKDSRSVERLHQLFAEKKRVFDPSNEKQALFPEGATIIPNSSGTAEGFTIETKGIFIASLPGVPSEFRGMFLETVLPEVKRRSPDAVPVHRSGFRIFGLPESTCGNRIRTALGTVWQYPVSYRASFPEIHVILKAPSLIEAEEASRIAISAVGEEFVFTRNPDESLPEALHKLLLSAGETISVAESCTGGMLGMHLTSQSGSSSYFLGGALTYSNALKESLLGVNSSTLEIHGAVSGETACEMAEGIRRNTGASIGLSITGIAGPDGGSETKPVGTFFIGFSTRQETTSYRFFLLSHRHNVRKFASFCALDLLRRHLQGLGSPTYSQPDCR